VSCGAPILLACNWFELALLWFNVFRRKNTVDRNLPSGPLDGSHPKKRLCHAAVAPFLPGAAFAAGAIPHPALVTIQGW
jgi:hypothetical protein